MVFALTRKRRIIRVPNITPMHEVHDVLANVNGVIAYALQGSCTPGDF